MLADLHARRDIGKVVDDGPVADDAVLRVPYAHGLTDNGADAEVFKRSQIEIDIVHGATNLLGPRQ